MRSSGLLIIISGEYNLVLEEFMNENDQVSVFLRDVNEQINK